MAKDKERTVNPAAQQRKVDKNKALKKAKAEKQAQRNERLAHRNPDRIQRQIDDLKALESSGEIKPREKTILADLERDLKAIHKARESLGDKAPANTGKGRLQQDHSRKDSNKQDQNNANFTVLGKRRHDGQRKMFDEPSSGSETDESVRNIPMPRDTPPPMPRARMPYNHNTSNSSQAGLPSHSEPHTLPPRPAPVISAKTTYTSAPQIRDLKKEATSRFIPTAVKVKQDAVKGVGTLLEPEELDRLEQAGYTESTRKKVASSPTSKEGRNVDEEEEAKRLAEEEARFEKELGLDQKNTDVVTVDENEVSAGDLKGGDAISQPAPVINGRGGSMFSSLPKPTAAGYARHVEIEEVEDEDL